MFGTDRVIKKFQLDIYSISGPDEQEKCTAWGSVSFTDNDEFSNETHDDCVVFHLFAKPETYTRYAALVAHGFLDEMILSVRRVYGFYSEWSPDIKTSDVKVLTGDQEIVLPPGLQFKPPRLGHVGETTLYINRRLELGKQAQEPAAAMGRSILKRRRPQKSKHRHRQTRGCWRCCNR
jgi:hypothetical protein